MQGIVYEHLKHLSITLPIPSVVNNELFFTYKTHL